MSDIILFNTASGKKETFAPIDKNNIKMYVCGPTVYDDIHIGNARPLIVFDLLYRLLKITYGDSCVHYVRNITDIDDKIIARARNKNISINNLTEKTIADFRAMAQALACDLPDEQQPRASNYIAPMVTMIQQLLDNGSAYLAKNHVLFDIGKMPSYGQFARRSLDELLVGARVEAAPYKKSPLDFVLWKPSKAGEPEWAGSFRHGQESITIMGRPGWHIECSAMSRELLGENFDIHGGGQDLIFPHHQNELAQSLCAHPHSHFANYWVHNGFVMVEGKKMSKSEGNFITVTDLLNKRKIAPAVLRLLMFSTHYRQPLDFTERKLQEIENIWDRIMNALSGYDGITDENLCHNDVLGQEANDIVGLLANDLDTISFMKEIHTLIANINKHRHVTDMARLYHYCRFLGLMTNMQYYSIPTEIVNLNKKRLALKKEKNFEAADILRQEMMNKGYDDIRDTIGGTIFIARGSNIQTLVPHPQHLKTSDKPIT